MWNYFFRCDDGLIPWTGVDAHFVLLTLLTLTPLNIAQQGHKTPVRVKEKCSSSNQLLAYLCIKIITIVIKPSDAGGVAYSKNFLRSSHERS